MLTFSRSERGNLTGEDSVCLVNLCCRVRDDYDGVVPWQHDCADACERDVERCFW